ncbi:f-box protein [Fusarium langsethiae]|uniref:F-box protein n=1 Tax=Fusarium langsethiae TaxID=179993 RepID=A0A0M9EVY5_FUSLA|nr:f-box protein [Fusarium langsethiae]GKU03591.1 unnamed protein product [Fusarium langsethiae]GKU20042.1 unnamed protein product [Fusarium langsethiae]
MSWNSLPSELRLQILSHAAEGYLTPKEKAAPYATVSCKWQSVIEDIIFRNISLVIGDVIDLDNFAQLTSGDNAYRRDIIRNISVIIVLPRYQCEESCQPESADEIQQNNHVFTELMQDLLGILSTWIPNLHPHGLTLELNIKSYSDMEHHFHNIQMHDRFVYKHWSYGFAPRYRDSGLTKMMPKLRNWEICDKSDLTDRQGCIFSFSIDPSLSAASMSLKFRWPRYAIKQFLFCPDVRNAWDKVAILRTGNSMNYLVDEKDISLPQGANFELAPVHPFTTWLALRGNDRQLTEIYDNDLL